MRWFKNVCPRIGSIRPRISLRLSLCLVPICGIGFGWIGHHLQEHRAEERYVTQIYAQPLAPAKPPPTPVLLPVSGSPNSVWTVNLPTFTL